ncbi:hypothetical protein ACFPT7_11785 [Acidicapsa dinghuensis]|uniref:Uncharacterized protein n=1 Tax=Acidicapsa dinghuensis TaxID=2218256 RepID=A0ABW1EFA6_9BACT|nr:hypothetical protein [Acidicapsa dinghuensis]
MSLSDPLASGVTSFAGKLKQAVFVCLRLFLFCVVSLVAVSIAAWCVFVAFEPDHAIFVALQRTVGFIRIPLGVTAGLCIFFAAVSWNTPASHYSNSGSKDISRFQMTLHRRIPGGKREVS